MKCSYLNLPYTYRFFYLISTDRPGFELPTLTSVPLKGGMTAPAGPNGTISRVFFAYLTTFLYLICTTAITLIIFVQMSACPGGVVLWCRLRLGVHMYIHILKSVVRSNLANVQIRRSFKKWKCLHFPR
jgi:hypothetical protein